MIDVENLLKRMDAEFDLADEAGAALQASQIHEYRQRQTRADALDRTLAELAEVWRPRLKAFVRKFSDRVRVEPTLELTPGEARLVFPSPLAQIQLRFSFLADALGNLAIGSDLHLQPLLMRVAAHSQLNMSAEAIDKSALAAWIDDRLLAFVQTYVSLHANEFYLKDHLVEDPVAKVKLPPTAAQATLCWQGKTLYFIAEETKRAFEGLHVVASEGGPAELAKAAPPATNDSPIHTPGEAPNARQATCRSTFESY
jgi:YHS domain-containing protein